MRRTRKFAICAAVAGGVVLAVAGCSTRFSVSIELRPIRTDSEKSAKPEPEPGLIDSRVDPLPGMVTPHWLPPLPPPPEALPAPLPTPGEPIPSIPSDHSKEA